MKVSLCLAMVATTFLLLGATSFAQQQEEENKQVELGFVLQHPDFSFFPRHHGGGVGLPPLSPTTDDEIKCFRATHARGMLTCLKDLRSFFTSHKVSISTGCCSALENIEKTCKHESLFLKNLVSQQCSSAPSPSS